MKTILTIILPVYNGQTFLNKCIDSILNQSYKNYEFLIIDDCSTDNSKDIINNYHDSRINFSINKRNIGLTQTLNKGLSLAGGKYIARIDQDDTSEKDRIIKQIEYLENNPSTKLIGTWCSIIDENDNFIKSIHYPCTRKSILEAFVSYNPFIHSSVIFDKETVLDLGGYPSSYIHAQDFYLWYKIASKYETHNISEELVKIRWHNQRATNSELNSKYIEKESLYIYNLALKNPEIKLIVKLKGKLLLLFRSWFFRK